MKKQILLSTVIAIALFLSACGGSPVTATQAPKEIDNLPTETSAPVDATSTETASAPEGIPVTVILEDNTITSSLTTFQSGVKYTFTITNKGFHPHSFTISTPVSLAGSIDAAASGALLSVSRDQLPSGSNISVNFTFPDSAVGQSLEFSCLIPRHYNDGMLLGITVSK